MTGPRIATDLATTVDLLTGFPFKSSSYCGPDEGIRLVRGDNVVQRGIRWDGAKHWPSPMAGAFAKYELRPGDVVLAMDRPWIEAGLKVAEIRPGDAPSLLVQRVARVRTKDLRLRQDFLKWLLYTPDFTQHVLSVQTGTAVPHISGGQILSFKFELPELPEQRRIAGVLSAFDDLIDTIRQERGRLVELAQSVLQRSARHEKTFARVGDVADVLRGLSYKGSGLSDSGMPMVNMGSAENFGWLKRSGWKFYTGDFKPRHLAGARDLILVNTEQTWRQEILGWPLLVPGDVREALFSHHTYRVAFKPGTEWMELPLWAHLFTVEARSWIDGAVRGTTVANLPIDAVENLTFLVPGRLDPALKAAEALLELAWASEREVERLEASRDELLPLLMSGRITVDEAWEAIP